MILKLSLFTLFLSLDLFAINVLVSKEAINFEEKIDSSKVTLKNVTSINKSCEPLKLTDLENDEYLTTHYINKNTIICTKDVKKYQDEGVVFNFGGVEIEKKGKVIFENMTLFV